ncbi:MAG: hypothetical protein O8C66_11230 [Candidatus Methanoperedens sp.]|nr:hypothetical protein [Candidatus Methanoperedens sp.]MCZ7371072.1 hypothetical protein [Candidatus Methanoperedens sp.]
MKSTLAILTILVFASIIPFTEGAQENRSLEITSLTIKFDKTDATFTVNYDMGDLPKLYILLFGSKTLEPNMRSVFSNFDYEIVKMDQNKAILKVENISRYEKGYYLHDSRKLGERINTLIIYTPDSPRTHEFSSIDSTPNIFYR